MQMKGNQSVKGVIVPGEIFMSDLFFRNRISPEPGNQTRDLIKDKFNIYLYQF